MQWVTVDKHLQKVAQHGSLKDLIEDMCVALEGFSKHLQVADWQHEQHCSIRENLPHGTLLTCSDFAENYRNGQRQPSSVHWSHKQINIHQVLCDYQCPTKLVVVVSDGLKHDVQYMLSQPSRTLQLKLSPRRSR